MTIKLNGTVYAVGVASVSLHHLRRTEKYRVTTEDGRTHREVQATYMDFALNLGASACGVRRLMSLLRSTTDDIAVELPSSHTGTETYVGAFDNVSDEIITEDEDGVLWDNLTLSFTGTEPLEV